MWISRLGTSGAASGAGQQELLGFFKGFHGEGTGNRGVSFEEIYQSLSAFQIVEERLDGHSGSAEHRGAVHDLGVPGNRLRHVFILPQTGR